jgi:hypothetical protein
MSRRGGRQGAEPDVSTEQMMEMVCRPVAALQPAGRHRRWCPRERRPLQKPGLDEGALLTLLHRHQREAAKAGHRIERTPDCDGLLFGPISWFALHRVTSASVQAIFSPLLHSISLSDAYRRSRRGVRERETSDNA